MRLVGSAVLAVLILAGCGDAGGPGRPTSDTSSPQQSEGVLVLEQSATEASGTFTRADGTVTLRSVATDGSYDVTVKLNGMTLTAVLDPANGVATMDAYATDGGGDTQLLDADREALSAVYAALNRELDEATLTDAARYLRRAVSVWAQTPSTVNPRRTVMGESGRGYTMLCSYAKCAGGNYTGSCNGYYNWYSYAKHDCNQGGFSYERNQQIAQLGDHYSCSGDEYYLSGSTWYCGEPDHWWRPKVVGNCFGRCGGGCGGDTQYTLDATNHDGCVRNGHALASLYCDDQFTSASDDELFAPNCY